MAILQSHLPYTPWGTAALERLPGILPAIEDDAFWPDDAYDAQMALRDRLIRDSRDAVVALQPSAKAAASELLDVALAQAQTRDGFDMGPDRFTRPDGVQVAVNSSDPMGTLGRLFQEDYCILQKPEGAEEHRLSAAVLCFPAHWRLDEKIGHPLLRIHAPVDSYPPEMARRVQRLLDTLRPGRALWRANAHRHASPDLYTPQSEQDPERLSIADGRYLRSERQVLFALPKTGAVVFAIHTFIIEMTSLTRAQLDTRPERLR